MGSDCQRGVDAHGFLILQSPHHRNLTESSIAVNMKRSTVPPNARTGCLHVLTRSGVIEGAHGVKLFTVYFSMGIPSALVPKRREISHRLSCTMATTPQTLSGPSTWMLYIFSDPPPCGQNSRTSTTQSLHYQQHLLPSLQEHLTCEASCSSQWTPTPLRTLSRPSRCLQSTRLPSFTSKPPQWTLNSKKRFAKLPT